MSFMRKKIETGFINKNIKSFFSPRTEFKTRTQNTPIINVISKVALLIVLLAFTSSLSSKFLTIDRDILNSLLTFDGVKGASATMQRQSAQWRQHQPPPLGVEAKKEEEVKGENKLGRQSLTGSESGLAAPVREGELFKISMELTIKSSSILNAVVMQISCWVTKTFGLPNLFPKSRITITEEKHTKSPSPEGFYYYNFTWCYTDGTNLTRREIEKATEATTYDIFAEGFNITRFWVNGTLKPPPPDWEVSLKPEDPVNTPYKGYVRIRPKAAPFAYLRSERVNLPMTIDERLSLKVKRGAMGEIVSDLTPRLNRKRLQGFFGDDRGDKGDNGDKGDKGDKSLEISQWGTICSEGISPISLETLCTAAGFTNPGPAMYADPTFDLVNRTRMPVLWSNLTCYRGQSLKRCAKVNVSNSPLSPPCTHQNDLFIDCYQYGPKPTPPPAEVEWDATVVKGKYLSFTNLPKDRNEDRSHQLNLLNSAAEEFVVRLASFLVIPTSSIQITDSWFDTIPFGKADTVETVKGGNGNNVGGSKINQGPETITFRFKLVRSEIEGGVFDGFKGVKNVNTNWRDSQRDLDKELGLWSVNIKDFIGTYLSLVNLTSNKPGGWPFPRYIGGGGDYEISLSGGWRGRVVFTPLKKNLSSSPLSPDKVITPQEERIVDQRRFLPTRSGGEVGVISLGKSSTTNRATQAQLNGTIAGDSRSRRDVANVICDGLMTNFASYGLIRGVTESPEIRLNQPVYYTAVHCPSLSTFDDCEKVRVNDPKIGDETQHVADLGVVCTSTAVPQPEKSLRGKWGVMFNFTVKAAAVTKRELDAFSFIEAFRDELYARFLFTKARVSLKDSKLVDNKYAIVYLDDDKQEGGDVPRTDVEYLLVNTNFTTWFDSPSDFTSLSSVRSKKWGKNKAEMSNFKITAMSYTVGPLPTWSPSNLTGWEWKLIREETHPEIARGLLLVKPSGKSNFGTVCGDVLSLNGAVGLCKAIFPNGSSTSPSFDTVSGTFYSTSSPSLPTSPRDQRLAKFFDHAPPECGDDLMKILNFEDNRLEASDTLSRETGRFDKAYMYYERHNGNEKGYPIYAGSMNCPDSLSIADCVIGYDPDGRYGGCTHRTDVYLDCTNSYLNYSGPINFTAVVDSSLTPTGEKLKTDLAALMALQTSSAEGKAGAAEGVTTEESSSIKSFTEGILKTKVKGEEKGGDKGSAGSIKSLSVSDRIVVNKITDYERYSYYNVMVKEADTSVSSCEGVERRIDSAIGRGKKDGVLVINRDNAKEEIGDLNSNNVDFNKYKGDDKNDEDLRQRNGSSLTARSGRLCPLSPNFFSTTPSYLINIRILNLSPIDLFERANILELRNTITRPNKDITPNLAFSYNLIPIGLNLEKPVNFENIDNFESFEKSELAINKRHLDYLPLSDAFTAASAYPGGSDREKGVAFVQIYTGPNSMRGSLCGIGMTSLTGETAKREEEKVRKEVGRREEEGEEREGNEDRKAEKERRLRNDLDTVALKICNENLFPKAKSARFIRNFLLSPGAQFVNKGFGQNLVNVSAWYGDNNDEAILLSEITPTPDSRPWLSGTVSTRYKKKSTGCTPMDNVGVLCGSGLRKNESDNQSSHLLPLKKEGGKNLVNQMVIFAAEVAYSGLKNTQNEANMKEKRQEKPQKQHEGVEKSKALVLQKVQDDFVNCLAKSILDINPNGIVLINQTTAANFKKNDKKDANLKGTLTIKFGFVDDDNAVLIELINGYQLKKLCNIQSIKIASPDPPFHPPSPSEAKAVKTWWIIGIVIGALVIALVGGILFYKYYLGPKFSNESKAESNGDLENPFSHHELGDLNLEVNSNDDKDNHGKRMY